MLICGYRWRKCSRINWMLLFTPSRIATDGTKMMYLLNLYFVASSKAVRR